MNWHAPAGRSAPICSSIALSSLRNRCDARMSMPTRLDVWARLCRPAARSGLLTAGTASRSAVSQVERSAHVRETWSPIVDAAAASFAEYARFAANCGDFSFLIPAELYHQSPSLHHLEREISKIMSDLHQVPPPRINHRGTAGRV